MALPGYPPYRHILSALGCDPVGIETTAATRWAITGETLLEHRAAAQRGDIGFARQSERHHDGSRGARPNVIRSAEDAGIIVISDEIYHGLDYAFRRRLCGALLVRAIIVNSFSKYFCMTGWRIGWMIVPESLVRAVERLQQNLAISVPTLAQIAAAAAFDDRAELENVRRGYEENRRILLEGLPQAGRRRFCRPTAHSISMPMCRASRAIALLSPNAHVGGSGRGRHSGR
jgi:aspartate/methionine/tyrosine aminotransferase